MGGVQLLMMVYEIICSSWSADRRFARTAGWDGPSPTVNDAKGLKITLATYWRPEKSQGNRNTQRCMLVKVKPANSSPGFSKSSLKRDLFEFMNAKVVERGRRGSAPLSRSESSSLCLLEDVRQQDQRVQGRVFSHVVSSLHMPSS